MRYKYIIQRLQRFVSFISFDTIRSYTFESCKSSYRRESIVKFLYSVSKTFHIPCLSFNVAKIRNVLRIFFSYRKLHLLLPASIPTITILSPHFQISLRIRERVSLDLWKGRRKLIAGPFPSPAPSYALINLTGNVARHMPSLNWSNQGNQNQEWSSNFSPSSNTRWSSARKRGRVLSNGMHIQSVLLPHIHPPKSLRVVSIRESGFVGSKKIRGTPSSQESSKHAGVAFSREHATSLSSIPGLIECATPPRIGVTTEPFPHAYLINSNQLR